MLTDEQKARFNALAEDRGPDGPQSRRREVRFVMRGGRTAVLLRGSARRRADCEHVVVGADEDLSVRDGRRRDRPLADIVAREHGGSPPGLHHDGFAGLADEVDLAVTGHG